MKVYFISGLGADERVFKYLTFPESIEKVFIKWIDPETHESIECYAKRLMEQIDTSEEINLIGFSFGGMIAQEIAKMVNCKRLVIVSSAKTPKEYSLQFRLLCDLPLYKLIPPNLLKWSNGFTADYYFGVQNKEESKLLHQIIRDTDEKFLSWAVEKIFTWKNQTIHPHLQHIHGTSDRIFPYNNIRIATPIDGGAHFMMVSKSKEVSQAIMNALS